MFYAEEVYAMVDGHIHIERGEYTLEWIGQFVNKGLEQGLDEIWLLEHCYRFREFVPMYDSVCAYSGYVNQWFHRQAGVLGLDDYLRLIHDVRENAFPIKIITVSDAHCPEDVGWKIPELNRLIAEA